MLMGAAHDALRASNARVSLSPVLRTCNRVMAHRPTGSTQTDRIRLPYAAPETSRRAFFVKELSSWLSDRWGKEREP